MEPAELVQEGAQLLRSVSGISKPLNSTDEGECRLMYVDSTSACASPQRILKWQHNQSAQNQLLHPHTGTPAPGISETAVQHNIAVDLHVTNRQCSYNE